MEAPVAPVSEASAFGLRFHHLGLAVADASVAANFLEHQGYRRVAAAFDPLQSANLEMWRHGSEPDVEVITPAAPGEGAVGAILAVRPDGLVYHLCYTTDSLEKSLDLIEQAGLRPFEVRPPKPAVLFGGERVCFYLVLGFGLIELIQGAGDCVTA